VKLKYENFAGNGQREGVFSVMCFLYINVSDLQYEENVIVQVSHICSFDCAILQNVHIQNLENGCEVKGVSQYNLVVVTIMQR
jgi:hypothetical protein